MNFTVVWKKDAENDLVDIWIASSERHVITKAANSIDRSLAQDPFSNSESRDKNSRIMFELPLGIKFDVKEDDRLVTVWSVWRVRK
jgi:hypothetical protein